MTPISSRIFTRAFPFAELSEPPDGASRSQYQSGRGWRRGFEGSQDYDLNLRVLELVDAGKIRHIPKILLSLAGRNGIDRIVGRREEATLTKPVCALSRNTYRA